MVKLLIDFDIPIYQASCVSETTFEFDDFDTGSTVDAVHLDKENATRYLDDFVESLKKQFGKDAVIMGAISDSRNFRKELCETYKANRKDIKRPKLLQYCRDYIMDNYKCTIFPRLEGDDVLSIMATSKKLKGEKIIVTLDKDLKQVGVPIWDFKNKKLIDPEPFFFWTQCLSGDRVDGFNGIAGIGEKTARKILEDVPEEDYWKVIVETYEKHGMTEEDALLTARLAYMLRDEDYNRTTEKVKLWTP